LQSFLDRIISEMTYNVLTRTLNRTHSLTPSREMHFYHSFGQVPFLMPSVTDVGDCSTQTQVHWVPAY